ncbi:MAG: tetratricopeptide repeat protein, partial [Myxococcota bacterium]
NATGHTADALALLDTLEQQAAVDGEPGAEPGSRTELLMLKAVLELRLKQPDRVEATLLNLLDLDPTHEPAYAMLFELYEDDPEQHEKINPLFRRMAAALPQGRLTRLKLAQAFIARGQNNRALELLDALLAEDPDDATALRGQLTIALRNEDLETAGRLFERLLELTPRDLSLLNQAAQFYFAIEETDKGLRVRLQAIGLRPFSAETAYLLGAIHHELGEHEQALAVIDRAIETFDRLSNPVPLATVRAEALIALDRPDPAIDGTEALLKDPRFSAFESGIRYQLARSLTDAGYRDRATQTLLRNITRFPTHGPSCNSLGYTFAGAEEPTRKQVQYFEMGGHRGIWLDGWKAVTRHEPKTSFDDDEWELYHVAADPSECTNLAESNSDKLAELIDRWWEEAEIHGVLPLDDRMLELFGTRHRDRSPHPADKRYVYRPPIAPLPSQAGATLGGRSFEAIATVRREAGQDGVLFATGTENSGIAFFVKDDHLVFDYNAFDTHTIIRSTTPIAPGATSLKAQFLRGPSRTATVTLSVDGTVVGSGDIAWMMSTISSVGMSVALDA